jgi:hypothetical protein
MKKLILSVAVFGALTSALPAFAHDAKFHKEKPVTGTLASIDGDSLTLTTEKGDQKVTLTKDTKLEKDKAQATASKQDLKKGQHLMVFGTKLESGELVAREVMIHTTEGSESESEHSHNS